MRRCSKTPCQEPALATLTYNYADSQVVIGPLSQLAEPHAYDLCPAHAARITAPRGWEVLRIGAPEPAAAAAPRASGAAPAGPAPSAPEGEGPARGFLRVVDDGR